MLRYHHNHNPANDPGLQSIGDNLAATEKDHVDDARDSLDAITDKFSTWRSNHVDQKLADLEQEQARLNQNRHPEQLECLWGIHKYVDGKLRPEEERFKYALRNKKEVYDAEAFVIRAQYRQKVVDIEEKFLGRINDKMNELRKALAQEKKKKEEEEETKQ